MNNLNELVNGNSSLKRVVNSTRLVIAVLIMTLYYILSIYIYILLCIHAIHLYILRDFIFQNKLNMKNLYSYILFKCVVYISHTAGQSITSIYSSPNHCNNNITKNILLSKFTNQHIY